VRKPASKLARTWAINRRSSSQTKSFPWKRVGPCRNKLDGGDWDRAVVATLMVTVAAFVPSGLTEAGATKLLVPLGCDPAQAQANPTAPTNPPGEMFRL
jgi:hypothetical protein